ncbi:MAG: glycosyltransferase [Acholeplasmataceae bacterium]|nr:glycosyltransferase [Acholeplasmataceae bacterium]
MANMFVVVDASSKGSFNKLCRHRIPGALPFGAKYRLIDFTLSNCKNSDVTNVAIFPYGNYRSLADHIGSGDRWDLNRRKDGIFILPPKTMSLTFEDSISFQRMYEHLEYFLRSTQDYAMVSPANLVWNVDYRMLLEEHLASEADLTEILSDDNRRIKTFILSKKLLLDYITSYDTLPFRNLSDVFDYATNIKKHHFEFSSDCYLIDSPFALYEVNMRLLMPLTRERLFCPDRPIYSKETMSAPARYGKNALVKNSIIASGAVIHGQIENSIIGRKAVIKEGAVVRNAVIMNQCVIEANAQVEYAVLDKQTIVKEEAIVSGDLNQLYLSEKKQIVAGGQKLMILQVTSECHPFAKTGGLADVVALLARKYATLGFPSAVMLPLYSGIKEKFKLFLELKAERQISYGNESHRVSLYHYTDQNIDFYFLEAYDFFDRDRLYGYEDDGDRFAFFAKAALSFFDVFEDVPNIIHFHDWHLGLLPWLLKNDERYRKIKTILTIHNVEYQGVHDATILARLGIESMWPNLQQINFLEIGIQTASLITTVSETYRDELRYAYYAKNLVEALNRRDRDFYGILNGLDEEIDPGKDLTIAEKYTLVNVFDAKKKNKLDLQKRMGLIEGEGYFVIGMVSRIVEQKGFDILLPAIDEVLKNPKVEFVILGSGDENYINRLKQLGERYKNRVALNIGYNSTEPSYIYAGADAFLMPSRYEPCGTSQMIALKYGTIPIVRQTGGLNDTIEQFDAVTKRGNGFKFYNYDHRDLIFQIENALNIFDSSPHVWRQLIINAMNSSFYPEDTAKAYIELYRMVLSKD